MAAPGALEVPEEARQLLGQRHAEAGFSGGWAWAFSRSTLCLWRLGASESQQHSHRLPYASTGAAHFVAALPAGPSGGRSGVVLVSEDGNSVLWTNFTDPEGPEPLASRIPGRVTALAAADGSDGVLAVAGMADGTVHLLVAVPGRRQCSGCWRHFCLGSTSVCKRKTSCSCPSGGIARLQGTPPSELASTVPPS